MSQSNNSPFARRTATRNPLQAESYSTSTNSGISKPSWPSGRKQACISCRQRKKKCDGSTPTCGLCSRTGNACFYSTPVMSNNLYHNGIHYMQLTPSDSSTVHNGDGAQVNNEIIRSSREPLSPVSSNGHFQNQVVGTGNTVFDETYQTIDNPDHVRSYGNGGTSQILANDVSDQSFWGDLNSFALFPSINFGMDSIVGPLTPIVGQSTMPTPPYSAFDTTFSSGAIDVPVPSQDQFNILLETFVSNCHSLLPCLHLRRLRERTASSFQDFQSSPLFWAIAASGAWHHRENIETSHGDAWLQKSCALVDKYISSVKKPLETLQALVYIIYQSYVSATMIQMWMQLGNACRLVSMIGWDKIDGKSQPSPYAPKVSSPEEKEEQRRVVWVLFMLDRAMSCMSGWPLGIDDRYFMVRYPIPEFHFQQSDLSVLSEPYSTDLVKLICPDHVRNEHRSSSTGLLFRAYALLGRILTYHNNLHDERSKGHESADFSELESTLTKFHLLIYGGGHKLQNVPIEERIKEVWLNILIQTCTILLYHPTVEDNSCGPSGPSGSLPGFERCVNAMRNMVNKIKEDAMYNAESLLNPFLLPAYFLTCRFLILTWHETKVSADRNSIDVILMLIDRTADLWGPLASKYRKAIMADLARNPDDMRRLRRGTGNYLSADCRS